MNSEDKALMDKLGITAESKTIFHFAGFKYDRLSDAAAYAEKQPRPAPQTKTQHED